MTHIEEINDFNFNIDTILILLLFVFFFFLLIYIIIRLYKKNKKLQNLLNQTNEELLLEKKKEENISTNNKINDNIPLKELDDKEDNIIKLPEPIKTQENNISEERKPYQKNVLKNLKAPTSPINITNQTPTIKELKMNLNDFIKKERKNGNNVKILTSKDYEPTSNTINYMEQVSKRLEEATDNKNIELTEYERIQEEQAIISYQELIENKDKIFQLTDDEADIEFINELKNFRNSLNQKTE